MQIIAINLEDGQFPVAWKRGKRSHIVTYGAEIISTNDSMVAAKFYGECVHHQAQCAGKLD